MLPTVLILVVQAAAPVIYSEGIEAGASTHSGEKYAPEKAVDNSESTRWASGDRAPLPQWFEVRLPERSTVDTVRIRIAVDNLYSDWEAFELSFSEGPPIRRSLEPGKRVAHVRFDPRETEWVRVSILSVHTPRHYVGIFELIAAHDPDDQLKTQLAESTPLDRSDIVARGRAEHPCVNVTQEDVERALERIEQYEWARKQRDTIVKEADRWIEHDDAYWLQFLPEPSACYAYGFTGDPTTGGSFGTWAGARCSWDQPGQVTGAEGRLFPNEEFPDDGTGYRAPDGRIHYFVGIWNAWVTEQWTVKALPALSQAYVLTDDERYAERGTLLLDALASIYAESTSGSWDYPSNPPSGRFARPWYQVARTLVKYVDAYDFLFNSPSMNEPSKRPGLTRRENIERYLLLDGAYYCYEHSYHGALHNGHADYVRGALAVGCALDVPEYIRNAVERPFSIFTMLANNIDRDGRYYESSLGYAIHARNLYLTFADPLLNLSNEEYPDGINLYDDPRMQSCLLLPDLQVELAGRRPNFGDSAPDYTYKPMPERPFSQIDYMFLERLYAQTSDPESRATYGAALQYLARDKRGAAGEDALERLRASHGSAWLLWHAGEPPVSEPELAPELAARVEGSWVAGMKGMALLRHGEQAALLRFGPSLNHGDPDDLGLLYYANGYELSYDIGYGLGSTHCHVGWASSTVSHCLVTVDETNQLMADGSGGSLAFFGDLPGAEVVQATSAPSYSSIPAWEYRRTVALLAGSGCLVDVFQVSGGRQHDYGFGSIGTNLEPFGVPKLEAVEGSLAGGVAWGEKIGPDGDIIGVPNRPYWRAPPGNGYGFFFDVRRGMPESPWGGLWSIEGAAPTEFRMHVVGDTSEAIFASAPGLYPRQPLASYVLARREAGTNEPLESTFVSVYEPYRNETPSFDLDYRGLAEALEGHSAEAKLLAALNVLLLKGSQAGDTMTFRIDLGEAKPDRLVLHCLTAPSYGSFQTEWDGKPVGAAINLRNDTIEGPVAQDIGAVDASAGEHSLTIRTVEGAAHYIGLVGVSFGKRTAAPASASPRITRVRRVGERAVEIERVDGTRDLVSVGAFDGATGFGAIRFEGDFALLTGAQGRARRAELLGCRRLEIEDKTVASGPGVFEAEVLEVNLEERGVTLDAALPQGLEQLVAVFANPAYSRSTAYHIKEVDGRMLRLQANSLCLGRGRVQQVVDSTTFLSEITHEYAKTVLRAQSTRFFDGKRIVGESGATARVVSTRPGTPLRIETDGASAFGVGESFEYLDLSAGDTVRIALPECLDLEP